MRWLLLTGALCVVPSMALASPDAGDDASTDAGDAGLADSGSDASPTPDDSGGGPCPSLPCTMPSDDAGTQPEAGDDAGSPTSGCSCRSTPDAASFSPLLLLGAAAVVSAIKRRASRR